MHVQDFCFEWATLEVKFSLLVRWCIIYMHGRYVFRCIVLGVMADSKAPSSKPNPNTSRFGRSEARKEYKKWNASRVCLFEAFERWRAFRDEHGLKTDKDVAGFLLDNYVVKTTWCT